MPPNVHLQALSSRSSDHSPLMLVGTEAVRNFRGFRFESFWPNFSDVVAEVWNRQLSVANPFLRLHTKLHRTSRALRLVAPLGLGTHLYWVQGPLVRAHLQMSSRMCLQPHGLHTHRHRRRDPFFLLQAPTDRSTTTPPLRAQRRNSVLAL
jgi:hypothetical protein